MKYRNIIFAGFLTGSLLSLAILVVFKAQQPRPVPPHRDNDMENLAYGLAIGFNIVLALCSFPVLFIRKSGQGKAGAAILLLALPVIFTFYSIIALNEYTLMYCLPYLLVVAVLFAARVRKYKPVDMY